MIVPDQNILFIHIPKCGGSSIAAGLFKKENIAYKTYMQLSKGQHKKYMTDHHQKHATASYYKKKLKSFDDYYKFTVIRNPWERAISSYEWHQCIRADFDKFISIMEKQQHHQVKPILHFVKENDEIIVDDIFTFAQIDKVFDKLKLEKFHKKRRNSRKHFEELNSIQLDKLDEMVNRLYKDDIEFFGFKKFEPATRNVTKL